MWLYFRVALHPLIESDTPELAKFVVQNWECLDALRWQCLLKDCGLESSEVLAESGTEKSERGELITFNERKRKVTHETTGRPKR